MRMRMGMLAVVLVAGCRDDAATGRLTPGMAARVVSPDGKMGYAPVSFGSKRAMVEVGARVMVALDGEKGDAPGRSVTILAKTSDLRLAGPSTEADSYFDIPRSWVRPD